MYKMTMLQIQNTLIKHQHHWKISKMYLTWTHNMLNIKWVTLIHLNFLLNLIKSISWIYPLLKVKVMVFYSLYESCSKFLASAPVEPLRTGYVRKQGIESLPFQDMNKQPFLVRCFSTTEISMRRNRLRLHSNTEYLIQVFYCRCYVPIAIGAKLVSPG